MTWYLLHRGLLAAHSKLFCAEAIDQMATGKQFIGRQLFVPPCDDQRNWERVLMSIYNPAKLQLWGKSSSTDELLSLMRVAKTLKFNNLVTLYIGRLEIALPTTLDAFDAVYNVPKTGSMLKQTGYLSNKAELFETINVILDSGHQRALPCAYLLALMETTIEDVLQGTFTSDGSRALLHPKAQQTLLIAHARIYPIILTKVQTP
ncbi:hypothetical protein D9619_012538 [Psilocybe cf. subviscida]|uniref:BTB domain-containing protein n=1 Tax=Psilocybe cf. subviscida TaxID=2480587 RepID=A0A8H5B6Y1_9AGAR|nr:hypothetical protein D9619_012538 [Psilocybe cf. subviscida]